MLRKWPMLLVVLSFSWLPSSYDLLAILSAPVTLKSAPINITSVNGGMAM